MLRSGIYAGWVGHDNLGDEAMFEFCKERFPSVRWSSLESVDYVPDQKQFLGRVWTNPASAVRILGEELRHQTRLRTLAMQGLQWVSERVSGRVGILGGGTLINRADYNLETYLDLRKRTKTLVPVFGTGVASPEFWSSLPGWRDLRKEWVAAFADLPVVGVRGPLSRDSLVDAGSTNVVISGDPAIAYHRRFRSAPSMARPDRPLRVAINTGHCSGNLWGSESEIHTALLAATRWLIERKHSVQILPVWDPDVPACTELARAAQLPPSSVSPILASHDAFLEKIVEFDLMIALKLHATVLASAANVPCVVLEYQPKCLDFASSVAWQDFTIRTSQLAPETLIERLEFLIETLPQARKTLHESVGKLTDQFESYCQKIEPLILHPAASTLVS